MKRLFRILFCITVLIPLFSCSNVEDSFDYPIEILYGKWKGTAVYYKGEWVDISSVAYEELSFSIEFYEDGSYYGEGAFGNGYGTYEAIGEIIITYVDGKKYFTYHVKSLSSFYAEVTMYYKNGDGMDLRVKKVF